MARQVRSSWWGVENGTTHWKSKSMQRISLAPTPGPSRGLSSLSSDMNIA